MEGGKPPGLGYVGVKQIWNEDLEGELLGEEV